MSSGNLCWMPDNEMKQDDFCMPEVIFILLHSARFHRFHAPYSQ